MKVVFYSLGNIDYKECWDFQERLFSSLLHEKEMDKKDRNQYLIFCEHPHVYTLGKSGKKENLLIAPSDLEKRQAAFYHINRGGDITYHGPGQLVGYPVFDLELFSMGLKDYIFSLEQSIINALADFGIKASRMHGATGVWLEPEDPRKARKICAIGVRSSHWVTMHGFALNINTDLQYFSYIHPCGFTDKQVTSLEKELGGRQNFDEVSAKVLYHLKKIFNFEIQTVKHAVNE